MSKAPAGVVWKRCGPAEPEGCSSCGELALLGTQNLPRPGFDGYLGLEYDVIGIEEATTLSSRKHQDITTCCRTSKSNWRARICSTANPGGVGRAWYRAKFIAPFQERRETDTRFIPARVTDNAFSSAEYRRVLENLHGRHRRAWFEGDWDIAAGQFFTMFRRDVHVVSDFDDTRATARDVGHLHLRAELAGGLEPRQGRGEPMTTASLAALDRAASARRSVLKNFTRRLPSRIPRSTRPRLLP